MEIFEYDPLCRRDYPEMMEMLMMEIFEYDPEMSASALVNEIPGFYLSAQ